MHRNNSLGVFTETELSTISSLLLTKEQRKALLLMLCEADRINRELHNVKPDVLINKETLFDVIYLIYNTGNIRRTIHWYVVYRVAEDLRLYSDNEFTRFRNEVIERTDCKNPFHISQMTTFSTSFLKHNIDLWPEFINKEKGKNIDCLELAHTIKRLIREKKGF